MKYLIDTNVVLDALTNREPFAEAAKSILEKASISSFEGCLSVCQIRDLHYYLHHFLHDEQKTRHILTILTDGLTIIDVKAANCLNAMTSPIRDYEDAMLEDAAKHCGCDGIITRNGKDFAKSTLRILSPNEFLDLLGKK